MKSKEDWLDSSNEYYGWVRDARKKIADGADLRAVVKELVDSGKLSPLDVNYFIKDIRGEKWNESVEQGVTEEVDTGEYDARKKQPSSKEEQDKVFAKHRERMKNLDKEEKQDVSEEYDPSYDPDYRPYERPERDPDWDREMEQEREWEQERKRKPSTVVIKDIDTDKEVYRFPSTGGFYGDVRAAKEAGYDTDSGDYLMNWVSDEQISESQTEERIDADKAFYALKKMGATDVSTTSHAINYTSPNGNRYRLPMDFGDNAVRYVKRSDLLDALNKLDGGLIEDASWGEEQMACGGNDGPFTGIGQHEEGEFAESTVAESRACAAKYRRLKESLRAKKAL